LQASDVAGNVHEEAYYFGRLGLREAIQQWFDLASGMSTDNAEAQIALGNAASSLESALTGYDHSYFGNMFLGLEDAESYLFEASSYDSDIDADEIMALTSELAVAWMRLRHQTKVAELGDNPRFVQSLVEIDAAKVAVDSSATSTAFLKLTNGWFWHEEGLESLALTGSYDSAPYGSGAFADCNSVMDLILARMDTYIAYETDLNGSTLPGSTQLADVRTELSSVKSLLQEVVDFNDDILTDLEHVQLLLGLANAAELLKLVEDETTWVRNLRWGLVQIVWIYVNRDLFNASSWVGSSNPVIGLGYQRLGEGQSLFEAFKPDEFMQKLIDSRCHVIGIYNLVYEPDVDVPANCCEFVRELRDLDGQVPVPVSCEEVVEIAIESSAFNPATVNIRVGQTVRWVNLDTSVHSVASGIPGALTNSPLSSGPLTQNAVFSHTFDTEGTFNFTDEYGAFAGSVVVSP